MIRRLIYLITMTCLCLLPFIGASSLNNDNMSIYETIQSTMKNVLKDGSAISSLDESYYKTYTEKYTEYIAKYKLSKSSAPITDLNDIETTYVGTTEIGITEEKEVIIIDHLNTKDANIDADNEYNSPDSDEYNLIKFDNKFEEDSHYTDIYNTENEDETPVDIHTTSEDEPQTTESIEETQEDKTNNVIDSQAETTESIEETQEDKTNNVIDSKTDTIDTNTKTPIQEEGSTALETQV